jgi:hypothetical protein
MRLISIIIIVFLITSMEARSQSLASNTCDSTILTKVEYEKCLMDTMFNNDILARTNYAIFLKTQLLPKHRVVRKSLTLPRKLRDDLKQLKTFYEDGVNFLIITLSKEMDRMQKHVQPKAYISTLLALENFKIYPDVYAVLLNEIHSKYSLHNAYPKMRNSKELIDKIYASLDQTQRQHLESIANSITKERKNYTQHYWLDMFQGDIDEELRKRYNVLNFLIWTE